MDTAGQRSSDNVSVTVLPLALAPGGEEEVLPSHSQWPAGTRPLWEGGTGLAFHSLTVGSMGSFRGGGWLLNETVSAKDHRSGLQ